VIYQARRAWLTKFLPEFAGVLAPRFDYVEKHLNFVHAELLPTLDYNLAVRPLKEDCGGLEWKPENIANFREEDQEILISAELWASPLVPTLDKAALLFHEAVYYWMRTYYGSTDSDKSRHLVGILFSTLSPEQMKAEIIKVLGTYPDQPDGKAICLMTNSARNQIYVAYDQNTDDAELTVRMRCQDDADAKWCIPTSIECENIVPGPQHRCISENSVTHKIYVGKGRGLLEAQFNAHMSCYMGSLAQGASTHDCPDRSFMECN